MIGIALVHGSASAIIERNLPGWKAAFDRLVMISPFDDYYPGSLPVGSSEHHGIHSINRLMFAALIASKYPEACVFEYDTTFTETEFHPIFGQIIMLSSSAFYNDDPNFSANIYSHSPWIAKGEKWNRIAIGGWESIEGGFPDRWLALRCEQEVILQSGITSAFSWDREWTMEKIAEARGAYLNGATIIHGIKTPEVFDTVFAPKG